jgi:hypothetical protein
VVATDSPKYGGVLKTRSHYQPAKITSRPTKIERRGKRLRIVLMDNLHGDALKCARGGIQFCESGSGTQFQTFYFGPGWSALASVEVPGPDWSLDNLIVVVPELGTARFVFLAVLLFSVAALKQGALPKTHEKALVQVFGRGAE